MRQNAASPRKTQVLELPGLWQVTSGLTKGRKSNVCLAMHSGIDFALHTIVQALHSATRTC